jgi:hypothetical protein
MAYRKKSDDMPPRVYDFEDYPDPRDYFDPAEMLEDNFGSIADWHSDRLSEETELDLD